MKVTQLSVDSLQEFNTFFHHARKLSNEDVIIHSTKSLSRFSTQYEVKVKYYQLLYSLNPSISPKASLRK